MTAHEYAQSIAETYLIYKTRVGSEIYGTSVGDDDHDEMGVALGPVASVLGWHTEEGVRLTFSHYRYRAEGRGEHERSQPGDVEGIIYALWRYVHLTAKGNPSMLVMLYVPRGDVLIEHRLFGAAIPDLIPMMASQDVVKSFLRFSQDQLREITQRRGIKDTNRPELIEKYGFDTKAAYHALRLTFQGLEFNQHGRLFLPIPEPGRSLLIGVREGKYTFEETCSMIADGVADLERAYASCALPPKPNYILLDMWTHDMYSDAWSDG